MAVLIDTSVFVALERRNADLATLGNRLTEDLSLSTVTVAELFAGVWRADNPIRRRRREAIVEGMRVIPFDLTSARLHAELWASLVYAGKSVGQHDLLIASTALAHGYDVLTENLREFANVPRLVVRHPTWPA